MRTIPQLASWFDGRLNDYTLNIKPDSLRDPVRYIMSIGGKRVRPALLLASAGLYTKTEEFAFPAALAVEVFHNFSLVHDDIMDDADKRRNRETTHVKFGINDAILSGDAMLILSYQLFEGYTDQYHKIMPLFSKTAMEVCEGQALDMLFEKKDEVSIDAYIDMITKKTSVLIAAALGIGAVIGEASQQDVHHLYEFGKNMGIAFQIQDDLLDTFGHEEKVGKRIGGDIIQRKKTYLYLKSLELLSESQAARLRDLYAAQDDMQDENKFIDEVTALFKSGHVDVHALELKQVYQQLALSHLDALALPDERKQPLLHFANQLLQREF